MLIVLSIDQIEPKFLEGRDNRSRESELSTTFTISRVGIFGNASIRCRQHGASSTKVSGLTLLAEVPWRDYSQDLRPRSRTSRPGGTSGRRVPLTDGQECLDFLLRGKQPIVICPARRVVRMRTPLIWRAALEAGRLLVLSPFEAKHSRVTGDLAVRRGLLCSRTRRNGLCGLRRTWRRNAVSPVAASRTNGDHL